MYLWSFDSGIQTNDFFPFYVTIIIAIIMYEFLRKFIYHASIFIEILFIFFFRFKTKRFNDIHK